MLVTIYCDAAHQPGTSHGAGAAWARSNKGRLTIKKKFEAEHSTHAEAIIACMALLAAHQEWPSMECGFVNTDSLSLCKIMWPFATDQAREPNLQRIVLQIKALQQHFELRFKHVKGHQHPGQSTRAWLNNWCDEHATL